MSEPDYDNPAIDEEWCKERRKEVETFLIHEQVTHGGVEQSPAWHVAPYVSIWAIESSVAKGSVGWWAICGDLPTDYISSQSIDNPRMAMRAFSSRWSALADSMGRGEEHPSIKLGSPSTWPTLRPLLKARAELLFQFADDDSIWQD